MDRVGEDAGSKPASATTPIEIFELANAGMTLEQGDILALCPYIYPIKIDLDNPDKNSTWTKRMNVIILGHSCDIKNEKVDLVIVCPIWEINSYYRDCANRYKIDRDYQSKFKDKADFRDKIRGRLIEVSEGKALGYCILKGAALEEVKTEPMIVDFTNTYTLPLDFLDDFSKTDKNNVVRLRLKAEFTMDLVARFNYWLVRAVLPKGSRIEKKDIKSLIDERKIDEILGSG